MRIEPITEPIEAGIESAAEALLDLFVPESILPEQYFAPRPVGLADTPERRLMLAVLTDAVFQLHGADSEGAAEAEAWIRDQQSDAPFSFRSICEALAIDPSYLANGLLARRGDGNRLNTMRLRQPPHGSFTHINVPRPPRRRRGAYARPGGRRAEMGRKAWRTEPWMGVVRSGS